MSRFPPMTNAIMTNAATTPAFAVPARSAARVAARAPDPRLDRALRRVLWIGATLVLLLPAARGHSAWLGWMPLWLLGMPATALWALHRFRVPPLFARAAKSLRASRRRGRGQARRRSQRAGRSGSLRAA